MQVRRTQAERLAETRAALMKAGRALFAAKGYGATAAEEIVAKAGVTRGALYHHFKDKTDLFAALVEEDFAAVLAEVEAAAARAPSARAALSAGARAFLAASLAPSRRRIFLIDAPAVIGWAKWRALDARYGMGSLREGLAASATESGRTLVDLDAATHLLSGALNEAALLLAARRRDGGFAKKIEQSFEAMLDGLLAA
ncbi:MAG: TetR family transcriptional regulator [Hyphomonadaceae bacterium]